MSHYVPLWDSTRLSCNRHIDFFKDLTPNIQISVLMGQENHKGYGYGDKFEAAFFAAKKADELNVERRKKVFDKIYPNQSLPVVPIPQWKTVKYRFPKRNYEN